MDGRGFSRSMRGLDRWLEERQFSRLTREGQPTWMRLFDGEASLTIRVQRSRWNSSEFGGTFRINYIKARRPLGPWTRAEANDPVNHTSGGSLGPAEVREVVSITNAVIARLDPAPLEEQAREGDEDLVGDLEQQLGFAL